VPSALASRRLEVFAAVRARPAGLTHLDPGRLRFTLGASVADVRVPVHLDREAEAIVRGAVVEIALLLSTHHRRFIPSEELDRLILREECVGLPRAEDVVGAVGGGPDLRSAAQAGVLAHPALLGGVVCAWMGPGGRGRSFTALWIEVLRRALAEMSASRDQEETPLLVSMALLAATQGAAARIGDLLPGPPHDRYLRAAALLGLWVAVRTALARAWRDAGRPATDPLLARVEAVLSPVAFLGGRSAVLAGGATVYGCELAAGVPRAEDLLTRLLSGGEPGGVVQELARLVSAEEEVARRAELAVAGGRLREALAAALAAAEAAGAASELAGLRDLYCGPGLLAAAAAEEAGRKTIAGQLAEARRSLPGGEAASLLDEARRLLLGWRQKEPAAVFGLKREAARAEYAAAAGALLCDAALERLTAAARRALAPRSGAEAEGGADAEYEAGRLYRISARPGPILKPAADRALGHLFADVKDFARRTGLLGQAAMAEFLRSEFYLPILAAARQHHGGMDHLADRGGVAVNNLLGDAISLSGDIGPMVRLALEIRRLLAAYQARLAREVSSEVVAREVAAIEIRFAQELAAAARAVAAAEEALARAAPGTPERAEASLAAARAAADQTRLVQERERALARAHGEELEAGVFISWGPAPLVMVIEDEVFGRNRVAIADKINESARGTARASAARARADALLAAERVARGNPRLQHAWNVFVGQTPSLLIPPDAEAAALRAAAAGDLAGALRSLAGPVRDAVAAAARAAAEGSGDLYNSGAALSGEALAAFLEAVARERTVRRVEVAPEEIPAELAARWYFGPGPHSLVACLHPDGRVGELFRYAGKAVMKGLAPVSVWELCPDAGAPAALARAVLLPGRRGGAPG
jgi:hypothetical protein